MDTSLRAGSLLVLMGIVLIVASLATIYIDQIPLIGRLPGDIDIHGKWWSLHVPIVTGLLLSIMLTLIINLFLRRQDL